MKTKWKSKTWWMGLITAVGGVALFLFPGLDPEIPGQASAALMAGWGVLAMVLRLVTKDKIQLIE